MPQHPARHHAPAHHRHARAYRQVKGETSGHAYRLADLDVAAGARVGVAERKHYGFAPVTPPDAVRGSARHDDVEGELRLELEPGRRAHAGPVDRGPLLQD